MKLFVLAVALVSFSLGLKVAIHFQKPPAAVSCVQPPATTPAGDILRHYPHPPVPRCKGCTWVATQSDGEGWLISINKQPRILTIP